MDDDSWDMSDTGGPWFQTHSKLLRKRTTEDACMVQTRQNVKRVANVHLTTVRHKLL